MSCTYLYLDDEKPETVEPYIEEVEDYAEPLTIRLAHPKLYQHQIEEVMEGGYDGIILDLRLDRAPNPDPDSEGKRADYRASTLAQEIRTRAAESSAKKARRGRGECPIVLWSTDDRLDTSYTRDHTSHDLFDLLCVKQDIVSDEPSVPEEKKAPWVARRLVALAEGYDTIGYVRDKVGLKSRQFYRFLGFEERPTFLDQRLAELDPFRDPQSRFRPAHEYARFILRELLEATGPLIDRPTLAARLGIDEARSPAFDEVLESLFSEAEYTGPFAAGWPRWWASKVDEAWVALLDKPGPLRSTPADERVAILKEKGGVNKIAPADPIAAGGSTTYWVVCRATGRPLDPREGFVLETRRKFPWQGDEYVSSAAVLQGLLSQSDLILAPSEQRRADLLRTRS